MAYARDTDEADDATVRGSAVTHAEETRQNAGQTLDGDAAVDGVFGRGRQGTDPGRGVVVADRLDDGADGRRQHADEGSGTKLRPPELT